LPLHAGDFFPQGRDHAFGPGGALVDHFVALLQPIGASEIGADVVLPVFDVIRDAIVARQDFELRFGQVGANTAGHR
jgi:hypothetical protein